MPEYPWQPGMIVTSQRLRDSSRVGAVVFSALRTSGQAITSGTETVANAISWDTPSLDSLAGWSAAKPTRWTCTQAGWYTLDGAVGFEFNATGSYRDVLWMINGAVSSGTRNRTATIATGSAPTIVDTRTTPRLLNVGDYVELVPAHTAGVSVNTAGGSLCPSMSITYSGPA